MTRINSLLGSQTSSVDLCMQNSVLTTRNTSLNLLPDLIYGFVQKKQRALHENYKSLKVPDLTSSVVYAKQRS